MRLIVTKADDGNFFVSTRFNPLLNKYASIIGNRDFPFCILEKGKLNFRRVE